MTDAFTLGVIGHVDHGKTALVRALTGTETDRLREERERGLSIVLGFAFLETPRGVVDFIDVPGHENFVRTMIGGATGLDGIVLCVAANEGVMPQTVEHFNIARLLGIGSGFIVITKADLVGADELALVRSEIDEFVRGTSLSGAPVFEASTISGAGIDAVAKAVADLAGTAGQRESGGPFFLPLDRVFTMRGFGVVATGTLRGGDLRVGDTVEIVPGQRQTTVRALQNHNLPADRVSPGQRVAVNLRHADRESVRRGSVLAVPGAVVPTVRLDVSVRLIPDMRPLKNGASLRFLTGTTEAMASLRLLDRHELQAGESAIAQLDLDREVATRSREPFLIRSYSPMHTIGGGRVLAVNPDRHRRFDTAVTKRLEAVASGNADRIVRQRLDEAGASGLRLDRCAAELGVDRDLLPEILERAGAITIGGDFVLAAGAFDALLGEIEAAVGRFHETRPLKPGLDVGSLASALPSNPPREIVREALANLVGSGKLCLQHDVVRIAGFDPFARLPEAERTLVARIEQAFRAHGLEAQSPETVVGKDKASQVLYRLLLETGRLVRLRTYDRKPEMVLHADSLEEARKAIERNFPYPETFALKDVRDLLGSTRKYVVPLMEHLDATGATVRTGDMRRLRQDL